ncbi:MAG: hypothetical protein A2X52_16600 [Candidatus Rokubacteria bacterium GWC2_70_16]|nr:MAG: hypothetical protein A2X52_16600 [Candidatus Rokubacteria bacterium GWC2_70_16]
MSASREKTLCWTLLGLALVLSARAAGDQWQLTGRTMPGFGVMDNLLVAVGGMETRGLVPFDLVRAVNGQLLTSGRQLQEEVGRPPPGTTFRYLLSRRGALVEIDVPSQRMPLRGFRDYATDGLAPSLLFLLLGAAVLWLKPGAPDTRLFLALCLVWWAMTGFYADAHLTYRFSVLFLTGWALSPAVFIHLALTFPQPRRVLGRWPRLVWAPYGLSALLALGLHGFPPLPPARWAAVPAVGAAYWGIALVLLVAALGRTSLAGGTPLVRQRGRVLMFGFAAGQLAPVLATASEAIFRITVPYLTEIWRLNLLFPMAVAYAMVRYDLFDVRGALRRGTVYAVVTGLVALAYAGAITLVNLAFSALGAGSSRLVSAAVVAVAVVALVDPVRRRTQAMVDRVFFRQQLDVQESVERLTEALSTELDLGRIAQLIAATLDAAFHPVRQTLLLLDEAGAQYRDVRGAEAPVPAGSALPACLAARPMPLTRQRFEEDPGLAGWCAAGVPWMDALGAEVAVPVPFQGRVTGFLALGPKRSGAAWSATDLRLLRVLATQSAVALENARAYTALERAHVELQAALRRVQLLESIRASLAKFVPRRVQELIEQAPEAPAFTKREVDVSVLFVDIAGYTRLSERFDLEQVNQLVERYFGSFLDEILRHGGDVSETAGDGLMVIFQDAEPRRHARAAVLTAQGVIRRSQQINVELVGVTEPIRLHVGVNSGIAAVGATKIEGKAGTRWVYTASGPVTNVAARLAALGEGECVFIGAETAGRLDAELPLEDLGEQRLRNVEEPVRVFRLAV